MKSIPQLLPGGRSKVYFKFCACQFHAKDNGDGEGPYNTVASWGTVGAADSFTTFMDSKTYTSKMSADETEVRRPRGKGTGSEKLTPFLYFTNPCIETEILG